MRTSLLLPFVLLACTPTGSTGGGKGPGNASDSGGGAAEGYCAVRAIFTASCTRCHGAGNDALGGLDLVTDPHGALVGRPSAAYADRTLVVPGDPDASFLYTKVTGTQAAYEGSAMPMDARLDATSIATIRSWIADGASGTCTPGDTAAPGDSGGGTARYHPDGWAEPTAHGMAAKYQQDTCLSCHGADLTGGTSGVSCDSCHTPGWRTDCTFCHGGADNETGAPPEGIDDQLTSTVFSAHSAHVTGTMHAPYDCTQCHAKPTDALSSGHFLVDDATPGKAENVFTAGLSPAGTSDGMGGCSNLYCHGNGHGTDGAVASGETMTCNSCHADSTGDWNTWSGMSGHHPTHLSAGFACAECHADTVASGSTTITGLAYHVNGRADTSFPSGMVYSNGQCTGTCHGEGHYGRTW